MKILDKLKKPIVVIGISTLAATGIIIGALCKLDVLTINNGQALFEKNNLPILKEYNSWTETMKNVLKEDFITKKVYEKEVINEYYTLVNENNIHPINNEANNDLMITFSKDTENRYPMVILPKIKISYFKNDHLSDQMLSFEAPYINGEYKYFDKKWYIKNSYLVRQTKDESIAEINKMVQSVNQFFRKQDEIKNSWSNVIPSTLALIDGQKINISTNEMAYMVDGPTNCKPEIFNDTGRIITCTEIPTKDGSTVKVKFLHKDAKDSEYKKVEEVWTVKNDNSTVTILRPNGYPITRNLTKEK